MKREINARDNHSVWWLNGREARMKARRRSSLAWLKRGPQAAGAGARRLGSRVLAWRPGNRRRVCWVPDCVPTHSCPCQDVEELVRDRLKVQLDNLCQFLPQDKVGRGPPPGTSVRRLGACPVEPAACGAAAWAHRVLTSAWCLPYSLIAGATARWWSLRA